MTTAIIDSCHFTQLGLSEYLTTLGVRSSSIHLLAPTEQVVEQLALREPCLIFISEECFHSGSELYQPIKQLIIDSPNTLFCIFMSISNLHFDEFLCVRDNVIITSKSLKATLLADLIKPYLKTAQFQRRYDNQAIRPVTLSKTESDMLKMWMNGNDTIQISDKMRIKAKTISSHKGNIKRKIKTHNTQVIYHVVKLADNLTSGIYVNLR